jgi:hypothetical protein
VRASAKPTMAFNLWSSTRTCSGSRGWSASRGGAPPGPPPPRDRQGAQLAVILESDHVDGWIGCPGPDPVQELAKEDRLQGGLVAANQQGEGMRGDREARREPGERALVGDRVTRHDHRDSETGRQQGRGGIGAHDDHDLVDDGRNHIDRQVEERAPADFRDELVFAEAGGSTPGEDDAGDAGVVHRGGMSARATTGTPDREQARASRRSAVTSVVEARLAHSR